MFPRSVKFHITIAMQAHYFLSLKSGKIALYVYSYIVLYGMYFGCNHILYNDFKIRCQGHVFYRGQSTDKNLWF